MYIHLNLTIACTSQEVVAKCKDRMCVIVRVIGSNEIKFVLDIANIRQWPTCGGEKSKDYFKMTKTTLKGLLTNICKELGKNKVELQDCL